MKCHQLITRDGLIHVSNSTICFRFADSLLLLDYFGGAICSYACEVGKVAFELMGNQKGPLLNYEFGEMVWITQKR